MKSFVYETSKTAKSNTIISNGSGKSMPSVTLQKKEGTEEELLQGKFTTQKKGGPEEEEPVQGKFVTQKKGGPEEEEPLQMKPFQLAAKEEELPVQKQANNTGLPDNLKSGVENLSGFSMNDVKVHYNSAKPAQLSALAYAQGTDIHVAPGQEKHLPHEAWHVAQQKQGRVQPTLQTKGVAVNDDKSLESEADVMGAKAMQMKYTDGQKENNSPQLVQLKEGNIAQFTYGKDGKRAYTLANLNTKLAALNPAVTALTLADFGNTTAEVLNTVIAANESRLYDTITRENVIAFFTEALAVAAPAPTAITYTYEDHGDKHFPGGKKGTKFTAEKSVVNPLLEAIIAQNLTRIRTDAAGVNQTYYYTSAGLTQCPAGHALVIQIAYEHANNVIAYHGYPDKKVTTYSLSRAKGGTAIAS